jgi:hypothetical protein
VLAFFAAKPASFPTTTMPFTLSRTRSDASCRRRAAPGLYDWNGKQYPIGASFMSRLITNTEVEKSNIYGRKKTGFVDE